MDYGYEFEVWLCNTLPWQLNLSPSKSVAVQTKFSQFADIVRPLANKAPEEFEQFLVELKNKMEDVYKFKSPKGHRTCPIIVNGKFDCYPNGKIRYSIQKNGW